MSSLSTVRIEGIGAEVITGAALTEHQRRYHDAAEPTERTWSPSTHHPRPASLPCGESRLRRIRPAAGAPELHFAHTDDGWRLALHRYRQRGAFAALPVILCGGYACNRYFLDYDEDYSLARFLARAGFDAWVLELRGRGLSRAPNVPRPPVWTFDDLVTLDVPAAVGYVAQATSQDVTWVGHSMGGMVLYAYLGGCAGRAQAVRGGVTIAAPVAVPSPGPALLRRLGTLLLRLPLGDVVRQRRALEVICGLVGILAPSLLGIAANPANIDRHTLRRALRRCIGDVPRVKLQQLARWALRGEFSSADGAVDYRAALGRVRTPLLLIAGSRDRLAAPAAVRRTLDYLPPAAAHYLEFGRAHGHSIDYGHVDLILGRAAPAEVFPAVARWLAERAETAVQEAHIA
jgi:predicted alpha/beta hydrolase